MYLHTLIHTYLRLFINSLHVCTYSCYCYSIFATAISRNFPLLNWAEAFYLFLFFLSLFLFDINCCHGNCWSLQTYLKATLKNWRAQRSFRCQQLLLFRMQGAFFDHLIICFIMLNKLKAWHKFFVSILCFYLIFHKYFYA